jgi:large conductance mechanosensitive channel
MISTNGVVSSKSLSYLLWQLSEMWVALAVKLQDKVRTIRKLTCYPLFAVSSSRHKMKGATMFKGFRQFIMRGNVIDLAVAVVIGAAFGAVVSSFVTNILTPLIAAIVGKPDFSAFNATINGAVISYGIFLNALISFLLIAAAVYFFMVAPMNAWKARAARNAVPADPTSKKCPECLSEIPIAARRCAFCTSVVTS